MYSKTVALGTLSAAPANTCLERVYLIPAPKDPLLRIVWERGVAARKAAGRGVLVGDY